MDKLTTEPLHFYSGSFSTGTIMEFLKQMVSNKRVKGWQYPVCFPGLVAIASFAATEVKATPTGGVFHPEEAGERVEVAIAEDRESPTTAAFQQILASTPQNHYEFDLHFPGGNTTGDRDMPRMGNMPQTDRAIAPFISAGDKDNAALARESLPWREWHAQTQPPSPPPEAPSPPTEDPDRDPFLQPGPQVEPTPPDEEEEPVIESPDEETGPEETPSPQIPVREIRVSGSTVLTEEQIEAITAPIEGTSVTLEELRRIADRITQEYLDRGYITSRAVLVDQVVENGIVEIRVIEGSLQEIEVQGNNRVRDSYIRSRIELGAGSPLNTANLEDRLRLLRLNPLFENIEASLRAGEEIGASILTVRVQEANPFGLSVGADNLSPPSVGSERLGGVMSYRNITGFGDEISAAYYWGVGDSQVWDFSYRIPINAMNGTLGIRVAPNSNGIIQPEFRELNIEGESELYEVSFRQPLVRSPRQEFALSLGFTHQESQTFVDEEPFGFGSGPDEDGIGSTSTIKFGVDYLRRDVRGAWSLRSLFNLGTGFLDATVNPDPIPDGRFFSWIAQVQRVQRIGNSQLLIVQGDLQLSTNSLLSSQQFVIGGGASLRGYRQNVRSGDNGFRVSVEDRIILMRDASGTPIFQLAPFVDVGAVWNHPDNPNELPDETFLAGVGMGILWQLFPGLNLRLDYGRPIFEIDDKGDNAQDEGFYFTVNYQL
ncbi:ShlB/FhaC/HecB family hemolysin secretion/activation protein [Phormidium sp. CCY1219]|uniref:ShlB/FhaC/HecB family hemolysin secretion/activation protein n=1 Tax=Phormidium sp. CCY1219 TaxID=2886104 RepID=UPI002D1F792F|nr:ShlB/FhaC/HecB family hemolysin secretion/activation protein [Phormidium sp. CCY1219]MEB3831260.1 ShlB/FhaC/HecB family hemolysin secretion/activation protein [Phormidium sp. CCY1219]